MINKTLTDTGATLAGFMRLLFGNRQRDMEINIQTIDTVRQT
jgi:hypothetical protein